MMGDLISRSKAVDALTDDNIIRNMDSVYDSALHRIKRSITRILVGLPSAKPNTKEHSQHVESVGCVGDTISRQAAIDAFEDTTFTKNEIRRRLLEVPSAQPESEHTMEEFMYGQDLGSPEDGSL